MIGRFGIGERESVRRVEVVLVLLPARDIGVGETVVEPHSARPGDMRQDAVEDLVSTGVFVESAIDKITQAAPGLRTAPGIGLFNRPASLAERVHPAGVIFRPISQKTHEIPYRGMAEPEYERVSTGINQLVDPARLKPSGDVNMAVGRDHCLDDTLVVEADSPSIRAKHQLSAGTGTRSSYG